MESERIIVLFGDASPALKLQLLAGQGWAEFGAGAIAGVGVGIGRRALSLSHAFARQLTIRSDNPFASSHTRRSINHPPTP